MTKAKKPTSKKVVKKPTSKKKSNSEVGYKKPPKHTQFKKGQSGNPTGINCSPEKRALKELTTATVTDAIKKALTCTEEEVTALLNDKDTPVGYKVILRAALQAAEHGEYSKFDHILERAIGKTPVNINMNNKVSLGEQLQDKEKVKQVLKEIENEV